MANVASRILNREVSVGAALEAGLWFAVPYVLIGVVVAFFHAEYVYMLARQFDVWLPAGADVAAFGQITVMWPGLLLTEGLCMH